MMKNKNVIIQNQFVSLPRLTHPFDLNILDISNFFPQVSDSQFNRINSELAAALHERNNEIVANLTKRNALNELLLLIKKVEDLLKLASAPYPLGTNFPIVNVVQVGSYRNGTLLGQTKLPSCDLVVLTNQLLPNSCASFINKVIEKVKLKNCNFSLEGIQCEKNDSGLAVWSSKVIVHVHFSIVPDKLHFVVDPKMRSYSIRSLAAIRHSLFFENNATPNVRILTRIIRDIAERHKQLEIMNPWMCQLLAYYATCVNFSFQPLLLHQSFLRAFRLLASGIFTPGSVGIQDPCEGFTSSVHGHLTIGQQEALMEESQKVFMKILKEEFRELLNLSDENNNSKTEGQANNAQVEPKAELIIIKDEEEEGDVNMKSVEEANEKSVILIEPKLEVIDID